MAAAVAVYDLARAYPPAILAAFQVSDRLVPLPAWLRGSAPSFFFTLSIGVLVGIAAGPDRTGRHVFRWLAIVLGLEFAQLPFFADGAAAFLAAALPDTGWHVIATYWTAGTFDFFDIAAAVGGGWLALLIVRRVVQGASR